MYEMKSSVLTSSRVIPSAGGVRISSVGSAEDTPSSEDVRDSRRDAIPDVAEVMALDAGATVVAMGRMCSVELGNPKFPRIRFVIEGA